MGLEIELSDAEGVSVVKPAGEVDLNTSPKLRQAVLNAIKGGGSVSIDLSQVHYMDSSGVATLVEGLKSSAKGKGTFSLMRPSPSVLKVLQLARLDSLFNITHE